MTASSAPSSSARRRGEKVETTFVSIDQRRYRRRRSCRAVGPDHGPVPVEADHGDPGRGGRGRRWQPGHGRRRHRRLDLRPHAGQPRSQLAAGRDRSGAMTACCGRALGPVARAGRSRVTVPPSPEHRPTRRSAMPSSSSPRRSRTLAGWSDDDHAAAFATFRRTCESLTASDAGAPPCPRAGSRPARRLPGGSRACAAPDASRPRAVLRGAFPAVCGRAAGRPRLPDRLLRAGISGLAAAKPGRSRSPLLVGPDDLVTIPQGETLPGIDPAPAVGPPDTGRATSPIPTAPPSRAARSGRGPGRSCICANPARPSSFMCRVRRASASRTVRVMRVAYAGRNGQPYTSIGRLLVEQGEMDAEHDDAWSGCSAGSANHPGRPGPLMQRTAPTSSFARPRNSRPTTARSAGPGVPLTAGPLARGRPRPLGLWPAVLARGRIARDPRLGRSRCAGS